MDKEKWFAIALEAIKKLPSGSEFEISQLFEGLGWQDEPRGIRTDVGKYFAKKVMNGAVPGVERAAPGRNNHRFYRKG